MTPIIDIIIPTWNNPDYLTPCIRSIAGTGILQTGIAHLHIVNNGSQPIEDLVTRSGLKNVTIHSPGKNLGWEGGLQYAIERSKAPFLVFQNDDTFIPYTSGQNFYQTLLIPFQDDNVAAVGPVTTVAAGAQSIYGNTVFNRTLANWLIFFTVMVRRSHLEEVGGVDTTLPGGDDLDLSFRFNKAGKKVMIEPKAFLIHHGFKTGNRVHGDHSVIGGWNSIQMSERTNRALIHKHGFKTYFYSVCNQLINSYSQFPSTDVEGDMIRKHIKESDKVLELGCGFRRTVPQSITVDRVESGSSIPLFVNDGEPCVADINADATALPDTLGKFDVIIARHLLEHILDPISALKHWRNFLRPGGRIILAVPDERVTRGIPLCHDHVHAFTKESLATFAEASGLLETFSQQSGNGTSLVSIFQPVSVSVTSGANMTAVTVCLD